MPRQFNVDAGELLEEQSSQLAAVQRENLILRHQLKDAEKQIDMLEAQLEEREPTAEVAELPKRAVRDTKR